MRNELAAVNYMAWKKRWLQLRVPNSSGFNPTQINVQQCTENGAVTDVPAISRMQTSKNVGRTITPLFKACFDEYILFAF